jgi:hypothetical protein
MGMHVKGPWDLIWHCGDCLAFVGCHQGTDVPLGLMANVETRRARYLAHETLDPLWKGKRAIAERQDVYAWIASFLGIRPEVAHISMLNEEQCNRLIEGAAQFKDHRAAVRGNDNVLHWKQRTRKKRRK